MSSVDLVEWLRAQLDEDERIARAASGGTVVGEPGNWREAPGGDEWEAQATDCGEEELLVALRPGLPRPPDVMGGYWGAVAANRRDDDPQAASSMPQLRHAAVHDPARVLREIDAKRRIVDAYLPPGGDPHPGLPCTDDSEGDPDGVFYAEQHPAEKGACVRHLEASKRLLHHDYVLRLLALPYKDRPGYREEW